MRESVTRTLREVALKVYGWMKTSLRIGLNAPTSKATGVSGSASLGSVATTQSSGIVTYWAPTLADGTLTETSNGWKYSGNPQGNANVSVVDCTAIGGYTGKAVRYLFNGTVRSSGDTQAEAQLAGVVGTLGLTELWFDFYIYYPIGGEVIAGVTQPGWVRSSGINTANNNKFGAVYKNYVGGVAGVDALRRVNQTWMPISGSGVSVEGQLFGAHRDHCNSYVTEEWAGAGPDGTKFSFERSDKRGIWRRIQWGNKIETSLGSADGWTEVWCGDDGATPTLQYQVTGLSERCSTATDAVQWQYFYHMGYQNAATLGVQYCYTSRHRYSSGRLTD